MKKSHKIIFFVVVSFALLATSISIFANHIVTTAYYRNFDPVNPNVSFDLTQRETDEIIEVWSYLPQADDNETFYDLDLDALLTPTPEIEID